MDGENMNTITIGRRFLEKEKRTRLEGAVRKMSSPRNRLHTFVISIVMLLKPGHSKLSLKITSSETQFTMTSLISVPTIVPLLLLTLQIWLGPVGCVSTVTS